MDMWFCLGMTFMCALGMLLVLHLNDKNKKGH